MRLFIAINFNDEIKKELVNIQNRLKKCALRGNFTAYNTLHLTLVFLGEVSYKLNLIHNVIVNLTEDPFNITIRGIGRFKRDRGDIWWAGIDENKNLILLHRQLSNALTDAGFSIDERPYTPHLTLARQVKLQTGVDIAAIGRNLNMDAQVSKISRMHSHRVNGVLTYTEIYEKKLRRRENV